uniref:F-box domain-containing protein n=1 Tax=Seriola lalandi dorsalis TaxID=1841481 RepID=A0A3B4WGP2_SERLL
MQHDPTRTSPVFLLCEKRPSLTSAGEPRPHNFVEMLPTEMSVKIFGELDAESLCSAACTCRLWHDIIEESNQLWRKQCLLVRAVCQREVDSDRRDGLSWKVGRLKDKQTNKQTNKQREEREVTGLQLQSGEHEWIITDRYMSNTVEE